MKKILTIPNGPEPFVVELIDRRLPGDISPKVWAMVYPEGGYEEDYMVARVDHLSDVPPRTRRMTREEVIEFLERHKHTVVRYAGDEWSNARGYNYNPLDLYYYEYAYIEDGKIGEPHKFEIEEDASDSF